MRTLAITNQKGGAGKTTTAVNLAAALAELGRRVLVLDLDPQASASAWLGVRDGGTGLLEALRDGGRPLAELARETSAPGVELIASSVHLTRAERELAAELGGERVLWKLLQDLPPRWDYVLVDCPPALGLLTANALVAVGEVLVPVEASMMAVAGLASLLQTVRRAQERLNPALAVAGIFACRVDARTNLARDVVTALRERFPASFLVTVVRESVRLREAWAHSLPINRYAPKSSGAEDHRALAAELLGQKKS
ncbi:MAG TPA: ParA family protein [Thermoanaerobaculia bacterium]|nr:ParA family protein [Thermoanaerobaculia bacterium]